MPNQELILLAHAPTESVNDGFLPAARRLGLSPLLLTDQAETHRQYFSQSGLPAYPEAIIACEVFNPLAVIEALRRARAQTCGGVLQQRSPASQYRHRRRVLRPARQKLTSNLPGEEQDRNARLSSRA